MNFDYIGNEYAWIERQFGKQGVDWTRELQSLVEKDGKYLDSIRIRSLHDGKQYDVLFDVTGPFVQNVQGLRAKLQGHVGSSGQVGVANAFPAVQANSSASLLLQDCDGFFQRGVTDYASGKDNTQTLIPDASDYTANQVELYRTSYGLGRYGETKGWPELTKQAWAHEAGRAIAEGLDDSLAGRGMIPAYVPYEKSLWSQDDLAVLTNAYYAGFKEGEDLRQKSKLGTWILAGLVALAGVGGVIYWQSRKSSEVHPLEEEVYANPSWDLQNARSREEYRQFRLDELQAIVDGRWPRDTNDIMRWTPRTAEDREQPAKYVARVIRQDLKWLDDLERRISKGDPDLSSYQPRLNPLAESTRTKLEQEFSALDHRIVMLSDKFESKYGGDWMDDLNASESADLDKLYDEMTKVLELLGWPEYVHSINPAKHRVHKLHLLGGETENRPVVFEHGKLIVLKIAHDPRRGFKTGYVTYTVHESVTGLDKRLLGFDKLADAKEFALEFGDLPVLAQALKEAKNDEYGPGLMTLGTMMGVWKKQHPGVKTNPSHGKDRPMTVQTLLFDKELWSVQEAKDWAKEHGNKYGSVDVKGRNIRLRQNDPSAFQKGSYATIPFGEGTGIQAVVARPKR